MFFSIVGFYIFVSVVLCFRFAQVLRREANRQTMAPTTLAAWLTLAADFEGVWPTKLKDICAHAFGPRAALNKARALAIMQVGSADLA